MNKNDQLVSEEPRQSKYITWGVIIGSVIGLFTGIFWFEMGVSLLLGTAFGLIVGAAVGSFIDGKSKSNSSNV